MFMYAKLALSSYADTLGFIKSVVDRSVIMVLIGLCMSQIACIRSSQDLNQIRPDAFQCVFGLTDGTLTQQ